MAQSQAWWQNHGWSVRSVPGCLLDRADHSSARCQAQAKQAQPDFRFMEKTASQAAKAEAA